MAGCVLLLGTLVVLFSGSYMMEEVGEEKYYAMLLAMMGLMIGLAASDLFNLWVWFEGMAISSYLLVAFYREQSASLEAGMKYLVQSATGSVLVLMGIALVLTQTGTLDMAGSRKLLWVCLTSSLCSWRRCLVRHWLWCQSGACPIAHMAARCALAGAKRNQCDAFGCCHRDRFDRHAEGFGVTGLSISWGLILMIFGTLNILYGNLLALRQTESNACLPIRV